MANAVGGGALLMANLGASSAVEGREQCKVAFSGGNLVPIWWVH